MTPKVVARVAARRARQVDEITSLVAAGHHERATGLALVHLAEFPEDGDVLERLTAQRSDPGRQGPARQSTARPASSTSSSLARRVGPQSG